MRMKELHPSVDWRSVRSLLLSFNSLTNLKVFISFDSFVSFPMLNMLCLGALWSQFGLTEDVGRRWKTLDFERLGPGVTYDSRNQPLNE